MVNCKLFVCLCIMLVLSMVGEQSYAKQDIINSTGSQESVDASEFVDVLSKQIISIMDDAELPASDKEGSLASLFIANVDTNWMGRFVLGRYNRTISSELKKRYLGLYHTYLIRSYVPRFKQYGSRGYIILRTLDKGRDTFVVKVKLDAAHGDPEIFVDYRVMKRNGVYKLVDIVGEGISLIATQRSDFGGLISRKSLEYFVDKLEQKVAKLEAQ